MIRERRRGRRQILLVAIGIVSCWTPLGCGGPIGPIPGGALSGEVGPRDITDWTIAAEVENAQLETRPSDPHSVNTWFAGIGRDLYLPTSMILGPTNPKKRSWVAHVAEDARVRIRLGRKIYERVAVRVENPNEFERVREALEARYSIDDEDRDSDRTIWIYRLDPRPR